MPGAGKGCGRLMTLNGQVIPMTPAMVSAIVDAISPDLCASLRGIRPAAWENPVAWKERKKQLAKQRKEKRLCGI